MRKIDTILLCCLTSWIYLFYPRVSASKDGGCLDTNGRLLLLPTAVLHFKQIRIGAPDDGVGLTIIGICFQPWERASTSLYQKHVFLLITVMGHEVCQRKKEHIERSVLHLMSGEIFWGCSCLVHNWELLYGRRSGETSGVCLACLHMSGGASTGNIQVSV